MIEHLKGIYEEVEYKDDSYIMLYDNTDFEAYPRHWHTSLEIILPTRGVYRIQVDNQWYSLREGDLLFICPGALHNMDACEGERYIFQAELSSVSRLSSAEAFMTMLYPGILITPELFPNTYEQFYRILNEIVNEYHSSVIYYDIAIHAKILEIITLLSRQLAAVNRAPGVTGSKQKEYLEKFMNVCNYITEHCTEDLDLETVAARTGYSKYHFSRLFKQFTNVNFYKFLNQKRVENAARLLVNPQIPVTEVSLASGFSSLSSFIRMFKLIKGCTPSEYRSMYNL